MSGYVSRGFHGKREAERENARVPPGQYIVRDFPVLSAGPLLLVAGGSGVMPLMSMIRGMQRGRPCPRSSCSRRERGRT